MSSERIHTSELFPGSREWQLAIRLCARLIMDAGTTPGPKARQLANKLGWEGHLPRSAAGRNRGSRSARAVYRVMRALEDLDLAHRQRERNGHTDIIVASDLADIAAWLADELEKTSLQPAHPDADTEEQP